MANPSSNVLTEIRAGYHSLANDPPNGISLSRGIYALGKAIDEIERLSAALEAVKRHIEAAEGIEVAFRAAKHFAAAYNAADEALAGSQHETNACQHDWTPQVKDIWCCEKCGRFERRGPCPDR